MERRKAVFRPDGSIKGSIPGAQWRSCKSIRREKPRRAGLLQSPLTDSNRRPPPYHGTSHATGGNQRQRFSVIFAVSGAGAFAAVCHWLRPRGSIKAPYRAGEESDADARSRPPPGAARMTRRPAGESYEVGGWLDDPERDRHGLDRPAASCAPVTAYGRPVGTPLYSGDLER